MLQSAKKGKLSTFPLAVNGLILSTMEESRNIVSKVFFAEQSRWILWAPVFLGLGIALYFTLSYEPPFYYAVGMLVMLGGLFFVVHGSSVKLLLVASAFLVALGFTTAQLRTHLVESPVIDRFMGKRFMVGTIERLELSARNRYTFLVRVKSLAGIKEANLPRYLRIYGSVPKSLHPHAGDVLRGHITLRPNTAPQEPGQFDPRFRAWFQRLGGVGFLHKGVQIIPSSKRTDFPSLFFLDTIMLHVQEIRTLIARHVTDRLEGAKGAIAVALMTGQRRMIPYSTQESLRASGLAHILAISGLHMFLFSTAVFWIFRLVLAFMPWAFLRISAKKYAAIMALLGAFTYLLISGASLATVRAFIMVGLVFLAIVWDRQALTMRNVALAAFIILLFLPESLFDIGFQLSFSAVIALVAFYETGIVWKFLSSRRGWLLSLLRFFVLLAFTSILAGAATASFAAYHFHRFAVYGLLANMLALPILSFLIMPMIVLFFFLLPFADGDLVLQLMGWGIDRVVDAAKVVTSLAGHARAVPASSPWALVLFVFGFLWLALWKRLWRWMGLVPMVIGLAYLGAASRADIYISSDARAVAFRNMDGNLTVAFVDKRPPYALRQWYRRDGAYRMTTQAPRLEDCVKSFCHVDMPSGHKVAYVGDPSTVPFLCRTVDIIISFRYLHATCGKENNVVIIDRNTVRHKGAHALWLFKDTIKVRHAYNQEKSSRPWLKNY